VLNISTERPAEQRLTGLPVRFCWTRRNTPKRRPTPNLWRTATTHIRDSSHATRRKVTHAMTTGILTVSKPSLSYLAVCTSTKLRYSTLSPNRWRVSF